jgi:hypothetical protein
VATTGARWSDEGFDIHVVAGATSRRLDDHYLVLDQSAGGPVFAYTDPNDHTTKPADVDKIEFLPRFVSHGPQPANSVRNDQRGVTVKKDTGEVTIDSPLPGGLRLRSFLIVATVTLKPPNAATVFTVPIRVHVHESVRKFWLTPSKMTIYNTLDGWRFSCLAEFNDDRTVGDISRLSGITWTIEPAATAKLDFVKAGEPQLKAKASPATNLKVTATLPASWGSKTADAKVDIKNIPTITAVPAGSPAGARADVPNVLIISEGFTDAENLQFPALAGLFVQDIRSGAKSVLPYNVLPINYWLAFVPSPQRGVSVMEALKLVKGKTKTFEDFDNEVAPSKPAGKAWDLGELLFEVGRPIPTDKGISRATKLGQWKTLYGTHITGVRVPQARYNEWQALAGWRLTNERDSALGIAAGRRPAASKTSDLRTITWHPFRMTRSQFEKVLDKVQDGSGTAIGSTWKAGKDRALVFALCGGAPASGSRTHPPDELIASGVGSSPVTVVLNVVAGSAAADVSPFGLPSKPSLEARATLMHEISHAFGLLDEYGERKDPPPSMVLDYSATGNLHALKDLDTGGQIDGNKLKWRWLRIRNAGILTVAPAVVTAGSKFKVTLQPGTAAAFKKGKDGKDKIVRLRKRDLLANPIPTERSGRLKVTVVDTTADTVTIERLPGETVTIADFPAGSLLIEPVRAPDSGGTLGDDRELVAPVILAHINHKHSPLNRATAAACAVDGKDTQKPKNLPPRATMRKGHPPWDEWIIGLYDGGDLFHCGVFHPAGACLMRQLTVTAASKKNPGAIYPFCQVCRYFLVDRIDPTKHRVIEKDYAKNYPQP